MYMVHLYLHLHFLCRCFLRVIFIFILVPIRHFPFGKKEGYSLIFVAKAERIRQFVKK